MTKARARPEPPSRLERWIGTVLPASEGGLRPVVAAARARVSTFLLAALSLAIGAAAGFLLVLIAAGLPGLPSLVVGFAGGAIVGVGAALALASRYPVVRKVGAFAVLLAPILVLLAPFLWIGGLVGFLGRTRSRRVAAPALDPVVGAPSAPRRIPAAATRRPRGDGTSARNGRSASNQPPRSPSP